MSLNDTEDFEKILNKLKAGAILTKRKPNGDKYSRQFYLDENESFLSYYQSEKYLAQPRRYYIQNMDEVRPGFQTLTFDELLKRNVIDSNDEQLAFSIFYNNYRNELHLMANDKQTCCIWTLGLQYLIDLNAQKRQTHIIRDTKWILSYLRFADKDKSNTIDKQECRKLLTDSLNIELSKNEYEKLFNKIDKTGEGTLNSDEFINFFHELTRRKDLYQIMQKYVKNADEKSIETICMNIDELLYFLQNVQNQKILTNSSDQLKDEVSVEPIKNREQVQTLINEFESNVELQKKSLLSLDGFTNLLLSDEFSLIKPWCSRRPYQDMTRPLSDYYINSSHNTYLFNTQVVGDSNPEAYNHALLAGCRVVELDCHDGDDGRPIVKHGYTLVKPCLFESIIRFIKPNLFKKSPYPVILDLENHCSLEQQKKMAQILKNVLGDQLVTQSIITKTTSPLPSPENLKYKVLIRTVKKSGSTSISKLFQDEEYNENDFFPNLPNKTVQQNLYEIPIFFENVPYREYENTNQHYVCVHSSSLSEKQFERVSRSDPIGLTKQTGKNLIRMYPDGLRQDSSNPNPIIPWNFGVQLVALNYQYDDHMMELCFGKFLDNASCGYVLKPNYLIDIEKSKFNPFDYSIKPKQLSKDIVEYPQRLIITIISGQFLCRSSKTTDDIPDPYVIISTHGILCDQYVEKTRFIENNGLNPIWKETFQFRITFPQMCLVRFDVYDYDIFSRDDRLAYFCLPMTTMQTGYRHIHLKGKDHNSTYSTLFIHVTIENE